MNWHFRTSGDMCANLPPRCVSALMVVVAVEYLILIYGQAVESSGMAVNVLLEPTDGNRDPSVRRQAVRFVRQGTFIHFHARQICDLTRLTRCEMGYPIVPFRNMCAVGYGASKQACDKRNPWSRNRLTRRVRCVNDGQR